MIWNRLKNNKCPKCGSILEEVFNGKQIGFACLTPSYSCTFFISREKFNKVIDNMYKKPRFVEGDNLSELNNLSRSTDDFNDNNEMYGII